MMRKRCGAPITSSILVARGIHGGEVVVTGTLHDVARNAHSETARCLKSPLIIHPRSRRSLPTVEDWIEISGAAREQLKDIDVRFPSAGFQ